MVYFRFWKHSRMFFSLVCLVFLVEFLCISILGFWSVFYFSFSFFLNNHIFSIVFGFLILFPFHYSFFTFYFPMVKLLPLLPWGHVFKSWKQPVVEMWGKAAYKRTKVVRPFPHPAQAGSTCIGLPFLFFYSKFMDYY